MICNAHPYNYAITVQGNMEGRDYCQSPHLQLHWCFLVLRNEGADDLLR